MLQITCVLREAQHLKDFIKVLYQLALLLLWRYGFIKLQLKVDNLILSKIVLQVFTRPTYSITAYWLLI